MRYFLVVIGNFSRRAIGLAAGLAWLRCRRLCAVAQLVRNRGTSVALCSTWCGNVDALHSRLKHLRLWRAGSERTPESSPHLSRVGASAPLGPSGATSRVMSAVKVIRLNGKPFFFKRTPSPLPCPQRLTNPMRHKAAACRPVGTHLLFIRIEFVPLRPLGGCFGRALTC